MVYYIEVVSLDEPCILDDEGNVQTIGDIIPATTNVEEEVSNRLLIESLPRNIVVIGEKRVQGIPLTTSERQRLHRFQATYRGEYNPSTIRGEQTHAQTRRS